MRAPGVRTLVSGLWIGLLTIPLLSLGAFRVYENQLFRQTEETLIAEAVVVGEAFRQTIDPDAHGPLDPPADDLRKFVPIVRAVDLRASPILAPATRSLTSTASVDAKYAKLSSLLQRAQVRNLSGVRVLDEFGVVVASPTGEVGYSLRHLPEVAAALRGEYAPGIHARASNARENVALSSISRASGMLVAIAVPVFEDPRAAIGSDKRVLGVIYDSRTPIDVEKSLWLVRDELVGPVVLTFLLTLSLVFGLSRLIARPIVELEAAARKVASGNRQQALDPVGFAPHEVRKLAESLADMRQQLEARAEYVRTFAANAAHELKTPLTSLRGAAELLLEHHATEDATMSKAQARKFLENIHEDAVRMNALVHRLLLLAKVESSTPSLEPVCIEELLGSIIERYARRGQGVKSTIANTRTFVEADPELLDTAFGNLLDNALRHGSPKPILVSFERSGESARVSIRDEGPPVDSSTVDRLFERFFTTERERGGTGLGLTIVKAVVTSHRGQIRVLRHDPGLEFIVEIPTTHRAA